MDAGADSGGEEQIGKVGVCDELATGGLPGICRGRAGVMETVRRDGRASSGGDGSRETGRRELGRGQRRRGWKSGAGAAMWGCAKMDWGRFCCADSGSFLLHVDMKRSFFFHCHVYTFLSWMHVYVGFTITTTVFLSSRDYKSNYKFDQVL